MTTQTETEETISGLEAVYNQIGFSPYPGQKRILDCGKRFILVTGGDQSGKSVTAAAKAVKAVLMRPVDQGAGLYWIVAVAYEQTRREFGYILDHFNKLNMVKAASKRLDPGFIELIDGTRFETKSTRDSEITMTMYSPDGIIACEASKIDFDTYLLFNSRLGASRGWLFMSGTMDGSLGWYPSLRMSWEAGVGDEQSFPLATHENAARYPGGWEDPEILRLRNLGSDDWVNERLLGIPSPPKGLVIREFRSWLHVQELEWDPTKPTHLAIDPGYAGAHAVLAIQLEDNHVFIFDEIYENKITEDMIDLAKGKEWWGTGEDRPGVSTGVIDQAGYTHQAMSAPAELWQREGVYLDRNYVKINDGTEVLRGYMKPDPITNTSKVLIDPKCKGLLSELGHCLSPLTDKQAVYRWKTDREGNIVGNTPADENNHAIKALIYFLVGHFGYAYAGKREKIRVKHW